MFWFVALMFQSMMSYIYKSAAAVAIYFPWRGFRKNTGCYHGLNLFKRKRVVFNIDYIIIRVGSVFR